MFQTIKKLIATALAAIILGMPVAVNATATTAPAGGVSMDSALGVINVNESGENYQSTINAKIDQIVKIQVWYHNTQPADSGKVAKDLKVSIAIPTVKTTNHKVTSFVGGSNTNTVTEVANVNTSVDTTLEYIPGTAVRKHNVGTNESPRIVTDSIPDSVVSSGYVVPAMNPCWNFQETITVQARVKAQVVYVSKKVKIDGTNNAWEPKITAKPGQTLAYLITFQNNGNTKLSNVIVRDSLPPYLDYVEGSATLYNTYSPNGLKISDRIVDSGVNIGNYNPGANAKIRLTARIPQSINGAKNTSFKNVAFAKADNATEYSDMAEAEVAFGVSTQSLVAIKITKYNDRNGNKYADKGEEGLSGVKFQITGNGVDKAVTTDSVGYAILSGLKPGTYTVKEIVPEGWENTTGISVTKSVTANEDTQIFYFGNKKKVTPTTPEKPETPTVPGLPTTGPAEAIGITLSILGVGGSGLAYRRSKRGLIDSLKLY